MGYLRSDVSFSATNWLANGSSRYPRSTALIREMLASRSVCWTILSLAAPPPPPPPSSSSSSARTSPSRGGRRKRDRALEDAVDRKVLRCGICELDMPSLCKDEVQSGRLLILRNPITATSKRLCTTCNVVCFSKVDPPMVACCVTCHAGAVILIGYVRYDWLLFSACRTICTVSGPSSIDCSTIQTHHFTGNNKRSGSSISSPNSPFDALRILLLALARQRDD